jgi:hypothetical protein
MLLNASQNKGFISVGFVLLISFCLSFPLASQTQANIVIEKHSNYGVIKGVVRDQQGNPIKDAIVAVFHLGTSKVLKQVRSSANGSFWTRIIPGRYTILAVAEGFNAETVQDVSVNRATELNYGFKLERAGSGNTLPEKSVDKPSTKIKVRRAYQSRSIYQNREGKTPIDENASAENKAVEETITAVEDVDDEKKRRPQSVFETYFAGSDEGSFTGFNFATIQPLGQNTEIVIAGQTGSKSFAPNRIETTIKHRPNSKHQIRLTASAAKLGKVNQQELGQISFQALDEWNLKNGVILVLGFDASKFVGAGNDFSISPRLGAQFEIDAKTRVKTAFTTQTEERTWSQAVELENSQVLFREQFAPQVIAVKEDKPLMNKSRRLEFGVERILDNSSSVEATAFLDTVTGRGVGLVNLPFNALDAENLTPFTVEQHGKTQGGRVVYARRFNGIFSTQAGYAFGTGQKISSDAIDNPANIFENGFFQTFVGQVNADLGTGTRVQTIFRLSPQATVFAIDPFQGRLAIYDPGLSILVTHPLPNLGLPFRATAIIDARNLLDFQTGVSGEEGSLRLNSQQRILRGGISVRF